MKPLLFLKKISCLHFIVLFAGLAASNVFAQGTAFTYQGRLNNNGVPVTGIYDLQFSVYDTANSGSQIGGATTNSAVGVTNGLFTVTLDFGAGVFTGQDRWLEIAARTNGAVSFITLGSRHAILATPYAVTASNLTGNLPATQVTGTFDVAQIPALDASKITTGTLSLSQLPPAAITNNQPNVDLSGTFTGNGAGLTNINVSQVNLIGTFTGNGSGLTNLNVTNLIGTIPDAQLPGNVALINGTNTFTGINEFTGVAVLTNANNQIAGTFSGNGAGLTNIGVTQVNLNLVGTFTGNGGGLTNLNATNLTGTIPDAQIPGNVALLNGANTFTGTNQFVGATILTNANNQIAGTFTGDGSGLSNIDITSLGGLSQATITGTFSGNGSDLTNLNAANVIGMIPDAQVSANVALLNGTNIFTGTNQFAGVAILTNANNEVAGTFNGDGSGLTSLNSANLTGTISGTLLSENVALRNGTNVFTGTNQFEGYVKVDGFQVIRATTLSPDEDGILIPTSGYVKLTPASAVTLNAVKSIEDGSTPGQMLILEGTSDTNTVTIKDDANTKLVSDRQLSDTTILNLMWNGSDWVEISFVQH